MISMGQASGFAGGGGIENGEGGGISQPSGQPQQPSDLSCAEPGVSVCRRGVSAS